MTHVVWFLMLLPAAGKGHPTFVDPTMPFADPVSCQVEVVKLRDLEPGKRYECRAIKGPLNLTEKLK